MTQSFKDMLCLLGAGAQGKVAKFDHKLNIEEVRKISLIQGIWPIVYMGLKKSFPDDTGVLKYDKEAVAHMALNIQRMAFVHGIITEFEDNGISCCVLKGEVLSHLYAQPYSRISSDYDILIDEAYEEKAAQILVKRGYDVQPRPKNHQHFQAMHPVGGMLEVHVKMYSDTTRDILLSGMVEYSEPYVTVKTDDIDIKTLGINDNLMFLTAHFLKHFLTGEVAVRQIIDLLLYMNRYKAEYDSELYKETLSKLNLTTFMATLEGIGSIYFGMDTDTVFDESLVSEMLDDTERIKGFEKDISIHSEVAKAKFNKGEVSYQIYREKHKYKRVNSVFPNKEYLIDGGYKYAKHMVLVPVAWVHRFLNIALSFAKKRDVKPANVNNRMELAKKLGLY